MENLLSKQAFKEAPSRQFWADLCRVIAIFGVILIHACGSTFYQFGKVSHSDWLAANLIDSLVRCAVPLFVMLSGALLLKTGSNQITVRQIINRVTKVAVPLFTWNVGYLLYVSHFTGEPVKWTSMFIQPPMYHLWFVYMIIGVYILLPVFQSIFTTLINRKDLQIYLLSLWLIATCIPIYQPMPLLSLLQQSSLLGYGGYFLIGGVAATSRNNKLPSIVWWLIYAASVTVTFYLTLYSSQQAQAVVETAFLYFSLNVFVSSVAAFVLFTRAKISERFGLILQWISDRSFLIFFMHVVILEHVSNATLSMFPSLPAYLFILISATATFVICLAIATVLRLLPASRTVLG